MTVACFSPRGRAATSRSSVLAAAASSATLQVPDQKNAVLLLVNQALWGVSESCCKLGLEPSAIISAQNWRPAIVFGSSYPLVLPSSEMMLPPACRIVL